MDTISLLMQIEQLKTENERLKNCNVDCSKCLNKGVADVFSQESFCVVVSNTEYASLMIYI